jgi:hypothetical protein
VQLVAYLPPFNNISILFNIPLHGAEVSSKFQGPTFVYIIREKLFAVLVVFRQVGNCLHQAHVVLCRCVAFRYGSRTCSVISRHLFNTLVYRHRSNALNGGLTVFSTICLASSCQSFASRFPSAISAACSSGPPHESLM